jgi:proline dehydrogenase
LNPAKSALLWASQSPRLKRTVPRLPPVRRAVRRFMPGEDVESALAVTEKLSTLGMTTIITRLGENLNDLSEADAVTAHYLRAIDRINERGLETEVSIKLTQLGLDLDHEYTYQKLESLIEHAGQKDNWVWIDMELSEYVDITLDLYRRARQRFSNIGVCLQSYLYRTVDDLDELIPLNPAIRLVKGAYMEPKEVAFPRKQDVDDNFMKCAEMMLPHIGNGLRAAFGTHDVPLLRQIVQQANSAEIPSDAYEIQMLYGIGISDQRQFVAEHHNVRVLISYGPDWYPWYMRRLAERPANVMFVLKNLF